MPGLALRFPVFSETLASIKERQSHLLELRCELQELIAISHNTIFQSLKLIAEAKDALARK
jgi:hypothetical protein